MQNNLIVTIPAKKIENSGFEKKKFQSSRLIKKKQKSKNSIFRLSTANQTVKKTLPR